MHDVAECGAGNGGVGEDGEDHSSTALTQEGIVMGTLDYLAPEQARDTHVEPRLPTWESLDDEQMLEHIPRVAAVANQVEANLRSWVQELRRREVTWSRIGTALGISRQSAWERFSGEE